MYNSRKILNLVIHNMARIRKSPEERKHSLIMSAILLFSEKGYAETSISDIASHSGIAKATFFHYFQSKRQLFNELYQSQATEVITIIKNRINEQSSAINILQKYIDYFFDCSLVFSFTWHPLLKEVECIEKTTLPYRENIFYPFFEKVLKRGIEEGVFSFSEELIHSKVVLIQHTFDGVVDLMDKLELKTLRTQYLIPSIESFLELKDKTFY